MTIKKGQLSQGNLFATHSSIDVAVGMLRTVIERLPGKNGDRVAVSCAVAALLNTIDAELPEEEPKGQVSTLQLAAYVYGDNKALFGTLHDIRPSRLAYLKTKAEFIETHGLGSWGGYLDTQNRARLDALMGK